MSSKAAKESFVSGHGGTTVFELATVLVACSVGYTLRNVLLVRYPEFSRATRQSILYVDDKASCGVRTPLRRVTCFSCTDVRVDISQPVFPAGLLLSGPP